MSKKLLTLLITILLLNISLRAQTLKWAKKMGGAKAEDCRSMAVDNVGNVYTTGSFSGTADFDPGPGIYNLTSTAGAEDIFVCKLDSSGNLVWAKKMSGTFQARGYDICLDAYGNVYTTGFFYQTVDFDPGVGTYNLTATSNTDVFISKLDNSGNFVWAKRMGGTSNYNFGYSIIADDSGNVYTTGAFWSTVDFDPGPGTYNLSSAGGEDIFIQKLSAAGNFIWAKRIGGNNTDRGSSLLLDASQNLFTTGIFSGTVDFDPGAGTFNLSPANGNSGFISKLDSAGNFIWARGVGGNSMVLDPSGNIYLTGAFVGTTDFNPGAGTYKLTSAGSTDIFIAKLTASGNFVWAKGMGDAGYDIGGTIRTDSFGNVYTIGYFEGTVDFDPGPGSSILASQGSIDIFVSKMDATGNLIWAKKLGGTSNDFGYAIEVKAYGNILSSGFFNGTANFDPDSTVMNLTSGGGADVFVQKMSQCGITNTTSPLACHSYTSPSGKYTWSTSGNYLDTITYAAGCHNIIAINLTIKTSTTSTVSLTRCDSYISPSGKYNWDTSGTYMDTIPNSFGCDSIMTINLTIKNSTTSTVSLTRCYSYVSPSGKYNWTTSGTYKDTIPNSVGCDSVITINLIIKKRTTSAISLTRCDSYIPPSGKYNWTTSGIYKDTIPNSAGCDSVITINLTIKKSTTSTTSLTRCDSYTSPSGKYNWTVSGVYKDTIPNSAGCDSVITINLTINNSSTSSISPVACFGYTSPSGKLLTAGGIYKDTIANTSGCDSIITINLTINTVNTSVTNNSPTLIANATGASYQWLDCGNNFATIAGKTAQSFTASSNGSYSVEVTQNGCTDTSACFTVSNVGIPENNLDNSITLYPNPSDKLIHIDLGKSFENVSVSITNALGQLVYSEQFSSTRKFQIKLEQPSGVYFITIRSQESLIAQVKAFKR